MANKELLFVDMGGNKKYYFYGNPDRERYDWSIAEDGRLRVEKRTKGTSHKEIMADFPDGQWQMIRRTDDIR